MTGTVYIASMNMRGVWAPAPPNTVMLNVTSAQGKLNKNRRDFSPMTPIHGGYKGYWNFESYWQSGKVYSDISHAKTKQWWQQLTEPKRRYPGSKGKQVLYAKFDHIDENLDYISSRKRVYIPEYYNLIKQREQTQYWIDKVNGGANVVVYDFDGPRTPNGSVDCHPVDLKLLLDKINDPTHPFGHGYVVAGAILGITPDKYAIVDMYC